MVYWQYIQTDDIINHLKVNNKSNKVNICVLQSMLNFKAYENIIKLFVKARSAQ